MRIRQVKAFLGGLFSCWMAVPGSNQAVAEVPREVVGAHRLTLSSGPNFVSAPLHGPVVHGVAIQSVSAATVAVVGSPGWTVDALAPRDGFPQYIALVRKDASEDPGVQGDWWPVAANGSDSLTLDTRGEDLTTLLAAGDEIEVRRLRSMKDLFGSGAGLKLIPDTDFDVLTSQEDVLRFVEGVSFTGEVFYHSGAPAETGYYFNGTRVGNGDGSTITLLPNQPFLFFRRTGAAPLELLLTGAVLKTRFTHYLMPGPNALGSVFPVPSPIATANLLESGWASDENFDPLSTEEDIIRAVYGTSFGEEVFHHASLVDALNGWYVNGDLSEQYAFQPTRGFVFTITGASMLRWRQNPSLEP